jgi:hypothetical protein
MNEKIRWKPYIQDSYKKVLTAVRTKSGKVYSKKWPNAGKFMGGDFDIPQEEVTHIVELGWDYI